MSIGPSTTRIEVPAFAAPAEARPVAPTPPLPPTASSSDASSVIALPANALSTEALREFVRAILQMNEALSVLQLLDQGPNPDESKASPAEPSPEEPANARNPEPRTAPRSEPAPTRRSEGTDSSSSEPLAHERPSEVTTSRSLPQAADGIPIRPLEIGADTEVLLRELLATPALVEREMVTFEPHEAQTQPFQEPIEHPAQKSSVRQAAPERGEDMACTPEMMEPSETEGPLVRASTAPSVMPSSAALRTIVSDIVRSTRELALQPDAPLEEMLATALDLIEGQTEDTASDPRTSAPREAEPMRHISPRAVAAAVRERLLDPGIAEAEVVTLARTVKERGDMAISAQANQAAAAALKLLDPAQRPVTGPVSFSALVQAMAVKMAIDAGDARSRSALRRRIRKEASLDVLRRGFPEESGRQRDSTTPSFNGWLAPRRR